MLHTARYKFLYCIVVYYMLRYCFRTAIFFTFRLHVTAEADIVGILQQYSQQKTME